MVGDRPDEKVRLRLLTIDDERPAAPVYRELGKVVVRYTTGTPCMAFATSAAGYA
jgi:hypothetical protein